MMKLVKRLFFCICLTAMVWLGSIVADRVTLGDSLIRLHVVANSDTAEDQAIKRKVRDAITASIREDLELAASKEEAYAYLQNNLPKLQKLANSVLEKAGVEPSAVVSLCKEQFGTRIYDTFVLPSGVYDALRITIGAGSGQNWWCVAFPGLCEGATTSQFSEDAVEAGLSPHLTHTLAGEEGYEVRFFLLDALGKLENILFTD